MTIGENIKKRRIELGWSQRELAKRSGYKDNSTIAKIENGKVDLPQSKIAMFAEVLNISVPDLMGWEEEEKKNDARVDITNRMFDDPDFFYIVSMLSEMNEAQIQKARRVLDAAFDEFQDKVE